MCIEYLQQKKRNMALTKSYLLGCLSNSILDSSNLDTVHVSELFSSVDHLKIIYELCQKFLSNHERYLSRSFTVDSRIGNELSSKTRVLSFTCSIPIALSSPMQTFKLCENKWEFIAGLIDTYSILTMQNQDLVLDVLSSSSRFLHTVTTWLHEEIGVSGEFIDIDSIVAFRFQFTNVLDLMGHMKFRSNSHVKWSEFAQKVHFDSNNPCFIHRKSESAIFPTKVRFSEVGYDISIIQKYKQLSTRTALYDTGISLECPFGYYVEIIPRSSLAKSGYIMTNSIGIIDRGYQGNIYVSLTKIEEDATDIETLLPFRCCQLVFRRQHFIALEEKQHEFVTTARGHGGYGSSGK